MKEIFNDILSAAGAEVSIIPVVQGEGMMKVDASQLPDSLPILALRNAVLFPGTVFPITIGREKSMRLINSRCAVICGGDFTDSCSITVSGTYLDRPNWDDEDSNTYSFSCTGASWYKQFEYND